MDIITDPYVGLYFYSAVFQGNMALLALVGVFAVFQIQMLSVALDRIENDIVTTVKGYFKENLYNHWHLLQTEDVSNLKSQLNKFMTDDESFEMSHRRPILSKLLQMDSYVTGYEKYHRVKQRLTEAKRKAVFPLISTATVIVVALLLLPISHFIHVKVTCVESTVILIVILMNSYALYQNISFVISTLRE